MGKIRIGIIGAGGIATGAHIPALKKLGDLVELAGCVSRRPERAEQAAREHGIAKAYRTTDEMLAEGRLDAVFVCTPNKFHAPDAIKALEAGCHVLCEKPPAMNAAEVAAMGRAAAAAGKVLSFAFNVRFETPWPPSASWMGASWATSTPGG